jgi:phage nucleotide-binding protein
MKELQVSKTSEIKAKRINALVYGQSGIGKTVLLGSLTGKTLIVDLENGLLSLKGKDIDYIKVGSLDELKYALTAIGKSNYENICIDSLTAVSDMVFEEGKTKYPEDRQTMKLYGYQLEVMSRFIRYCRDMDKNIFFTALEKTTADEIGRRFKVPDLHGSISQKAAQYFDFVFNYQIVKIEEEEKRVLITGGHELAICKDRSGKLNKYCKPDLTEIINKVFN